MTSHVKTVNISRIKLYHKEILVLKKQIQGKFHSHNNDIIGFKDLFVVKELHKTMNHPYDIIPIQIKELIPFMISNKQNLHIISNHSCTMGEGSHIFMAHVYYDQMNDFSDEKIRVNFVRKSFYKTKPSSNSSIEEQEN